MIIRHTHKLGLHDRRHNGDSPDCTVSCDGIEKDMAEAQIKALILNEYTKVKNPLDEESLMRLALQAKKNNKFQLERTQRIERFRSLLPTIFY